MPYNQPTKSDKILDAFFICLIFTVIIFSICFLNNTNDIHIKPTDKVLCIDKHEYTILLLNERPSIILKIDIDGKIINCEDELNERTF